MTSQWSNPGFDQQPVRGEETSWMKMKHLVAKTLQFF